MENFILRFMHGTCWTFFIVGGIAILYGAWIVDGKLLITGAVMAWMGDVGKDMFKELIEWNKEP